MFNSLLVLFSLPLISNSEIKMDLAPLKQFFHAEQNQGVDTAQLQQAIALLASASAEQSKISKDMGIGGQNAQTPSDLDKQKQLDLVLANLKRLSEQSKLADLQ